MPKRPPFYYPGNKYMDEKWTMIQEAILSVSEGNYEIELPKEIGVDHLDSILMALKMMAETLADREKIMHALGAAHGLDQGVLVLDVKGKLQDFNSKAQVLFRNRLRKGEEILALLQHEHFMELLEGLDAGMSTQESFEMKAPDGSFHKVEMTIVRPLELVGFSGAILQFSKLKPQ